VTTRDKSKKKRKDKPVKEEVNLLDVTTPDKSVSKKKLSKNTSHDETVNDKGKPSKEEKKSKHKKKHKKEKKADYEEALGLSTPSKEIVQI
jgi:AP-3 complex subunit delta